MRFSSLSCILGLLAAATCPAQTQTSLSHRTEFSVSVNRFALPEGNTVMVRPRLSHQFGRWWGGAVAVGWANITNHNQTSFGGAADVQRLFYRNYRTVDFSLVAKPLQHKRHQLDVYGGITLLGRKSIGVDSITDTYGSGQDITYVATARVENSNRLVPHVGASYAFRLSPRWSLGAEATWYFAGNANTPSTLGLRVAYRFNLRADSLGMNPVPFDRLRAGVRVAGTFSTENGYNPLTDRYRLRGSYGLYAELPLSLTWWLRGEILYAQKGYRSDALRLGNTGYSATFGNYNFLEFPLLFRHEVADRWSLLAGPHISFLLDGRAEVGNQKGTLASSLTAGGVNVGVLYEISDRFGVDARYSRDLLVLSGGRSTAFHVIQVGLNAALK